MIRDALVVGINIYKNDNLHNLKAPAEDAEAIAQILEQYGEFQVTRLPEAIDIDAETKKPKKPFVAKTKELRLIQLKNALVELFKPEGRQVPDTALFYFSGHGIREDKGIQEGFLATSDVFPQLGFNGLSLQWLRRLLQESPVGQQIIWLDCCHSGEILNFDEADPGEQGHARDRCFIASSREFEQSLEDLETRYSVLTKFLLSGLNPNRCPRQWITNYSLIEFINQNLRHENQRPVFTNFGEPINLTRTWDKETPDSKGQDSGDICPYKGLEYFDCNDKDPKYFYGREKLTDKLLDRVRQNNFLAILGASGSGKSSVLRAGLLHQLKLGRKLADSENWKIRIMLPGKHPLQSLALSWLSPDLSNAERATQLDQIETLLKQGGEGLRKLVQASTGNRVILVIDQFEEAFTLCQDLAEREAFFQCFLEALEQIDNKLCLILAMRIDFFGKCLEREYSDLGIKIQDKDNFIALLPMKREELKQAIIKPAEKVNLSLESGLAEQILRDIEGSPGSLPLLQDTLTELWKRRENNQLKFTIYSQLGGIGGTLNQRATEVYQSLTPQEQDAAQHIFLSLTNLGEGTEDTRRRILKQDLITAKYDEQLIDNVIQKLTNEKLLVTSDRVESNSEIGKQAEVDVAHEALIRNWILLRQWLDESRNQLRQKRKIEDASREWLLSKKNSDYLLRGVRLIEAESSLKDYRNLGMLDRIAEEFITESQNLRTKQEEEQERRRQQELEILELRRKSAELAKLQAEEKARIEAEKRAREQIEANKKLHEVNKKLQFRSLVTTIALMIAGFSLASGVFAVNSLVKSQEAHLKQRAADLKTKLFLSNEIDLLLESIHLAGDNQNFNKRWFKPENKLVPKVQSILYQAVEDSRERYVFNGHEFEVNSVALSPDGQYIVSGSSDKTIKLWDVKDRVLLHTFDDHKSGVNSVAFSPDGQYIVSGSNDNTVKLWDIDNNKLVHTFDKHEQSVKTVSFSPDGQYLVSGSNDKKLKLWHVEDKVLLHTYDAHKSGVNSVGFSPDGQYIVSGSDDKTVKLWDVENQILLHTFKSHKARVNSVDFSTDGQYIVSGSRDKTVKLWGVKDGVLLYTFEGHESGVNSVAFSPNRQYLVSGSLDKTVKLWDVKDLVLLHTFDGHEFEVNSVEFSPDGQYLVSGSNDKTVKLWDVEDRVLLHTFDGHESGVNSVSFSPDGQYLVSGSLDKTVKLWHIENQVLLHTFDNYKLSVNSVAFSPDGRYIVSGSSDKKVKLWLGTDWQDWMAVGCKRIRLHPTLVSGTTDSEQEAAITCDKLAFREFKQ